LKERVDMVVNGRPEPVRNPQSLRQLLCGLLHMEGGESVAFELPRGVEVLGDVSKVGEKCRISH
jgi:hypothetical protein